ncbi:TetR/AcrR family transcriptional regulator [Aquabacterium humicola]|uniref:TetR/AcrR family transcriptional regulator n=1 Tax=Aquabacterium humicola TaxID=3237377 RepID=UPI00254315CA|nr:TetR/AcrR family transcriptional regulator [Rubrivivax pictus]
MARPSQQLDQALLASGRALYAQLGCAGLSQRKLAEHAGISAGMFHYHFDSKDAFLRALLQQLYEEMYGPLAGQAAMQGPALDRLRAALLSLAGFVRAQRPVIVRLVLDAAGGAEVAREFLRANVPRHVGLLLQLLAEAEAEGALPPSRHPLQRIALLMGAVVAPMVMAPAAAALGIPLPKPSLQTQVTGDVAIAERIELVLAALCAGEEAPR